MGIDIAELKRQESISFFMWVQSLNKNGFPKNENGTMKDIWELYDYWDSMDGKDKKPFWVHARTKEPQAAALLSGEDWKEDAEEKDRFAIAFAVWALYDPQAQSYITSGVTAYKLLQLYKDRPYINTDPKVN